MPHLPVFGSSTDGFKWLSLIFLILMGALAGMIAGYAIQAILGIEDHDSLASMRIMQLSTQIGLFIVPPLVYVQLFESHRKASLGLELNPGRKMFILGTLLMLASLPLVHWLAEWNQSVTFPESLSSLEERLRLMEERAEELTKSFLSVRSVQGLVFNLMMIALIPAIGEELLFRALIQQKLLRTLGNKHLAVLMGALVFSILHFQFYGLIPRFMLGVFLGYFYLWSGSLWVPALMHFVNNGLAVVAYYLHFNGASGIPMEEVGSVTVWWQWVLSAAATAGLLFLASRSRHAQSENKSD